MSNIAKDYMAGKSPALSLFDYSPDFSGIEKRFEEIKDQVSSDELCNYLEKYNSSLNCGKETLSNIKRLRDGAKVVVTGQQSGLLLGPTYTIYKALTAVKLAEKLTQEGKDVVPVFWVADEDHDWQEVNHTYLLDVKGEPKELKITKDVQDCPICNIQVEQDELQNVLSFIDELGYDQMFIKTVREMLVAVYSENYSEWFAKLLTYILKDTGLVLIDSNAPIITKQAKQVFTTMLEKRSELIKDLSTTSAKITQLGHNLQNPFQEEAETNLFIFKDSKRYKLKFQKDGTYIIKTGETFSKEEILKDYVQPGNISPNVFLRLAVQDTSFPTVAFVAGPGEISYIAQIRELYQKLTKNKLPVVFPRQSFMIIEPYINKIMKRYALRYPHIHSLGTEKNKLIHNHEWELVQKEFQAATIDISQQYDNLIQKISTIHPQLSTVGDKNLQLVIKQVEYLQKKAFNFHQKNNSLIMEHFEKMQKNFYPNDIEQQRSLSIIYYLIKYDFSFIKKIADSVELTNFNLQYIEL